MYPLPEGPDETPEQIRELDDTLLSSDPLGYFMSRIGMLHHWGVLWCEPACRGRRSRRGRRFERRRYRPSRRSCPG